MQKGEESASFGAEMRAARLESGYPHLKDFAYVINMRYETYRCYERGKRIPSIKTLEHIIQQASLPDEIADKLRETANRARGKKKGVIVTKPIKADVDIPKLAQSLVSDFEFEAMRGDRKELSERTLKACARRAEMRLKAALEPK